MQHELSLMLQCDLTIDVCHNAMLTSMNDAWCHGTIDGCHNVTQPLMDAIMTYALRCMDVTMLHVKFDGCHNGVTQLTIPFSMT